MWAAGLGRKRGFHVSEHFLSPHGSSLGLELKGGRLWEQELLGGQSCSHCLPYLEPREQVRSEDVGESQDGGKGPEKCSAFAGAGRGVAGTWGFQVWLWRLL